MTVIKSIYDEVANEYDGKYQDPIHKVEDEINSTYLTEYGHPLRVLDIGCGTGSVIDWSHFAPPSYYGIDLSPEMVKIAKQKYPDYEFAVGDVTEGVTGTYSLITAVYGQLNHMGLQAFREVLLNNLAEYGKFYAVIYADTHNPDIVYENGNHLIFTEAEIRDALGDIAPDLNIKGLSFPDVDAHYQSQLWMTESGQLDGCKYWIVSG